MKTSIVGTFVTLAMSCAIAQNASPSRVTIPFNFTVGNTSFVAGDYVVTESNLGIVKIRSLKGDASIMSLSTRTGGSRTTNDTLLTFNRYGSSYFLRTVSCDGVGWRLYRSHREKEMMAKQSTAQPVVVLASLR